MLLEPVLKNLERHRDYRGYFMETFRDGGVNILQDNQIRSWPGVLRGLHYRVTGDQAKLVTVVMGTIFDVVVCLDKDNPNFRSVFYYEITGSNPQLLYVPRGYAHGFLSLTESIVEYKSTTLFSESLEKTLLWNDPSIDVPWPRLGSPYIVSEKDRNGGLFNESIICKPASR